MRQFLDPVLRVPRYFGRYEKPRYYSSDGATIIVPGSSNAPIQLIIAGRIYERTSNMECNINRSGEDGMNLVTIAANTPYYLYAIIGTDGYPHLIADVQEPARGPQGYSEWTYIGAFCTDNGSTTIFPFHSSGGLMSFDNGVGDSGLVSTTTTTGYTFNNCPKTATHFGIQLRVSSTTIGDYGYCTSTDSTALNGIYARALSTSTSIYSYAYWFLPMLISQTVYVKVSNVRALAGAQLYGWMEDVNAWL